MVGRWNGPRSDVYRRLAPLVSRFYFERPSSPPLRRLYDTQTVEKLVFYSALVKGGHHLHYLADINRSVDKKRLKSVAKRQLRV